MKKLLLFLVAVTLFLNLCYQSEEIPEQIALSDCEIVIKFDNPRQLMEDYDSVLRSLNKIYDLGVYNYYLNFFESNIGNYIPDEFDEDERDSIFNGLFELPGVKMDGTCYVFKYKYYIGKKLTESPQSVYTMIPVDVNKFTGLEEWENYIEGTTKYTVQNGYLIFTKNRYSWYYDYEIDEYIEEYIETPIPEITVDKVFALNSNLGFKMNFAGLNESFERGAGNRYLSGLSLLVSKFKKAINKAKSAEFAFSISDNGKLTLDMQVSLLDDTQVREEKNKVREKTNELLKFLPRKDFSFIYAGQAIAGLDVFEPFYTMFDPYEFFPFDYKDKITDDDIAKLNSFVDILTTKERAIGLSSPFSNPLSGNVAIGIIKNDDPLLTHNSLLDIVAMNESVRTEIKKMKEQAFMDFLYELDDEWEIDYYERYPEEFYNYMYYYYMRDNDYYDDDYYYSDPYYSRGSDYSLTYEDVGSDFFGIDGIFYKLSTQPMGSYYYTQVSQRVIYMAYLDSGHIIFCIGNESNERLLIKNMIDTVSNIFSDGENGFAASEDFKDVERVISPDAVEFSSINLHYMLFGLTYNQIKNEVKYEFINKLLKGLDEDVDFGGLSMNNRIDNGKLNLKFEADKKTIDYFADIFMAASVAFNLNLNRHGFFDAGYSDYDYYY